MGLARKFIIGEEDVKRMHVKMLVDTGSIMLAINENIQEQLQLPVVEKRTVQLQNRHIAEYDVVAPPGIKIQKQAAAKLIYACIVPTILNRCRSDTTGRYGCTYSPRRRRELIVHPDHPYFAQMKLKLKNLHIHTLNLKCPPNPCRIILISVDSPDVACIVF